MMTGTVTIARSGLLSTIQDRGRFGHRHLGIPWSGCVVPGWQQLANALTGNPLDHSIIESWEGGLQLSVADGAVRFAFAADTAASMSLQSDTHTVKLQPFRSYTAQPGDTIVLTNSGNMRLAVLAIAGLDIEPQLGSTSTYAKAGLGGITGDSLKPGIVLTGGMSPGGAELECTNPLVTAYESSELRVVLGPQEHNFSKQGLFNLLNSEYTVGSDADRMGVRLEGPNVTHKNDKAKDIVSDAIVPGSIQVPGNGQPIVLLSDAHTAGGYPKVATVISIDLPLLGLHRAGTGFKFRSVSIDDAIHATRQQYALVQKATQSTHPVADIAYSVHALLSNNLIDGVTDGILN